MYNPGSRVLNSNLLVHIRLHDSSEIYLTLHSQNKQIACLNPILDFFYIKGDHIVLLKESVFFLKLSHACFKFDE